MRITVSRERNDQFGEKRRFVGVGGFKQTAQTGERISQNFTFSPDISLSEEKIRVTPTRQHSGNAQYRGTNRTNFSRNIPSFRKPRRTVEDLPQERNFKAQPERESCTNKAASRKPGGVFTTNRRYFTTKAEFNQTKSHRSPYERMRRNSQIFSQN